MYALGLTAALLLSLSASAADPSGVAATSPSSTEGEAKTPSERLAEAVRLYQTGHSEQAALQLAALANAADLEDETLRQSARIYLGEVHYLQQNKEEARRLFEAVLMREPNYVMDPFAHPPDVCGFFETIRAYIRPAAAPEPVSAEPSAVPRTPASAYLGFGIYQLRHGDKRMGTALAVGQAAFAVASIVSFAGLLDDHAWGTQDELTRLKTQRAIQWSSTAGFYAFWLWSSVDAHRHWRANVHLHTQPVQSRMGTQPNRRVLFEVSFPTW